MKKEILLFSLILSAGILAAQTANSSNKQIHESIVKGKEIVIMYKGNVWHRSSGSTVMVNNDVTIAGIKVKPDGTVIFQNGSTTKLKNEDFIESDGRVYISSE